MEKENPLEVILEGFFARNRALNPEENKIFKFLNFRL